MRTAAIILTAGLMVSACTFTTARSAEERLQIACASWAHLFSTAKTRRQYDLATLEEIQAVNHARPILNPVCSEDIPVQVTDHTLVLVENALLRLIEAEKEG